MRHRPLVSPLLLAVVLVVGPAAAADPRPSPDAWGGSCEVPASPAPVATPASCDPVMWSCPPRSSTSTATQIEDGVFTFKRFCPWSAKLLSIEHDPDAPGIGWTSDRTDLPVEAAGGTSSEDRTFAQRMLLEEGSYALRWTTDDPLDLTVSGCPATIALLANDGSPAPGSGTPYPTIQPDDSGELSWPDLPTGWYDLFVRIECGWSVTFGPAISSAS